MLCCSMLAKGPSNGFMTAQLTTMFGTIVEKALFFKDLPSADNNAGYLQLLKRCRHWTAFIVCIINNFLPIKQGVGVDLGYLKKLTDRKNYCRLRMSLNKIGLRESGYYYFRPKQQFSQDTIFVVEYYFA